MCTANVCRSPMAEALLRSRLGERTGEVEVASAGVRAERGATHPLAIEALAPRGARLVAGQARRLTRADIVGADLVVGMARQHVRETVVLDRAAFAKSFTLGEVVGAIDRIGPRRADESLPSWLGRAHEGRRTGDLLGEGDHDIGDPIGAGRDTFARLAAHLDELIGLMVAGLWPSEKSSIDAAARGASRPSVVVAADRDGTDLAASLQARLLSEGYVVRSLEPGPAHSAVAVGHAVARSISRGEADLALCVSADGMTAAIAANRAQGVRAAVLHDATTARLARAHAGANVGCLATALTGFEVALDAVSAFVTTAAGDEQDDVGLVLPGDEYRGD